MLQLSDLLVRGKQVQETMSTQVENRLKFLSADNESVTGRSFKHFFYPILYRDEDTELCRAHVINRAFKESNHSWTVQRADVDSW